MTGYVVTRWPSVGQSVHLFPDCCRLRGTTTREVTVTEIIDVTMYQPHIVVGTDRGHLCIACKNRYG